MKIKYKKFLYCCSAAFLSMIASCSILEPETEDVVFEEDYFKTYHDINAGLWGVYSGLQPLVDKMFVLGEVRADLVVPGPGATQDLVEVAEHRVTPMNKYTDWSDYYKLINRANYMLENLGKIEKSPFFTVASEEQYTGELLYLRSLAYFNLVKNFGDVPLVLESYNNINQDINFPAVSQESILDVIEADLFKADTMVTPAITELNSNLATITNNIYTRTRGTIAAINALRTEVLLYRNKYVEADAVAQRVYNNPGSYAINTSAYSRANWFNIFKNKFQNLESIAEIPFTYQSREVNTLQGLTSPDPLEGGRNKIVPSAVAIRNFNKANTPGQKQLYDTFRGYGASYDSSASQFSIYKFIGLDRITSRGATAVRRRPYESESNFYIYRFADLQLMRAEAVNRMGGEDNKTRAIGYLNVVRARVGLAAAPVTKTSSVEAIEDAILKERALELAFEGKRWHDLVRVARHGRPEVLINAVKSRVPANMQAAVEARLSDPKNWYLPYNAEEVRLNPALRQK